jgi:hypothetical protein
MQHTQGILLWKETIMVKIHSKGGMVPTLQELFDSFPIDTRTQLIAEAGVKEQVVSNSIDVRPYAEVILAAILTRRTLTNEEFSSIVRSEKLPWAVLSPNRANATISINLELAKSKSDKMPVNSLAIASIIVAEASLSAAEVLAAVYRDPGEIFLEPPEVEKVEAGSIDLTLNGLNEVVNASGLVLQVAHEITKHLPQNWQQGAEIGALATGVATGTVKLVDKLFKWTEDYYKILKLKKELEPEKSADTPPAKTPERNSPAVAHITYQTYNIFLGQANLPPSFGAQVVNQSAPHLVGLLNAARRPELTINDISKTKTSKAMRATP